MLVDTSVAVPLLCVPSRTPSRACLGAGAWGRGPGLSGHALVETYAVLTRLPGDARLRPEDAVRLIDSRFEGGFSLAPASAESAHRLLADSGVAGGAAYDDLVALAAREYSVPLATRDARARATCEAVGVPVEFVGV